MLTFSLLVESSAHRTSDAPAVYTYRPYESWSSRMSSRPRLPWIVVIAIAAAAAVSAAEGGGGAHCAATPVRGNVVKAGVFTGYIVPGYDVVGGRFRLHVGDYRNRATGLSQKIPWFAPVASGANGDLVVRWTRLAPLPARRFTVRAPTGGIFPQGYVYPTSFSPPNAGCWRLTFRSGSATGSLTVLVPGRG
jgi:hypothetical protein